MMQHIHLVTLVDNLFDIKTLVIIYSVTSQCEICTFVCCSEHWATKYICWMMLWQLCKCGKILMGSVTDCDFFNISKLPFSENHKQKITFCLFDWFIFFGSYFKQMLNWFIRKHISYRYAVFFYRFFFPVKGIIFRPSYFRVNNVLFSPLTLRVTSKLDHSKCQPSIWHIHNCNHILRTIIMFKCMKASVYP